jgi:hypothetical protein
VHDAIQVAGNSGASPTMIGLHDVLRSIEKILEPFKRYIEAYEASMAQALPITQAPPMVQAPPIAQTTHANVLAGITKEPKFIVPEKFDGTQSKFWGFVQHVNLFLRLHPSCYLYDYTQVAFIRSLLSGNAFSWLPPFLEK